MSERTGLLAGFHEPVLVREVMEFLAPSGGGTYLDGTVGGGGHSAAPLEACPSCTVLAVDRDPSALKVAKAALAPLEARVRFIQARFDEALGSADLSEPLAGVLLDLGVSSHQLDSDRRGFAFRTGVELDMRMGGTQAGDPSAAQILNSASRMMTWVYSLSSALGSSLASSCAAPRRPPRGLLISCARPRMTVRGT